MSFLNYKRSKHISTDYDSVKNAQVLSMDNTAAGLILLVGQIANGVGTTVVGVMLDRPTSLWVCVRVGKLPIIILLS